MLRCKNCGISIPKSSDGFCSDKCKKEYQVVDKEYNVYGAFRIISYTISQMFSRYDPLNKKEISLNKKFLKSAIVSSFCDCSDNFEKDKLIKIYDEFVSNNKTL